MIWYPPDVHRNLTFRKQLLKDCDGDRALQASVKAACADDVLFWLNVFGWTHDPRRIESGEQPFLPFVTYPFQDKALQWMSERLGRKDMVVVKSRGVGVTWMVLALFVHAWLFKGGWHLGLVSRSEGEVDGLERSLFTKIDRLLEMMPAFLMPGGFSYASRGGCFRKELLLRNYENASVIEGSATTGNMFRGGRLTSLLWDEMSADELAVGNAAIASTFSVTHSRIMVATPQGAVGAFYDMAHNSKIARRDIWWHEHPLYQAGMVRREGTRSGCWSPRFQEDCDRLGNNPTIIAAEMELDFVGSASPFFPPELVDKLLAGDAVPPYTRGRLEFDVEKMMLPEGALHQAPVFQERDDGDLWLWMHLDRDGKPPGAESYIIGVDVSAGTGATNSVLSICEKTTGEKVGELATPRTLPPALADLAVALAQFLGGAFLIWEMNGPGGTFGQRVMDLGYRNVYYRTDEQSLVKAQKPIPGWHASNQSRRTLFGTYLQALAGRTFINRSGEALKELRQYVYLPNGSVGNQRAQASADPSGAGQNHGDRVSADALACQGLRSVARPSVVKDKPPPQYGSWEWRRQKGNQEDQFKTNVGMLSWESSPKSLRGWRESVSSMSGW